MSEGLTGANFILTSTEEGSMMGRGASIKEGNLPYFRIFRDLICFIRIVNHL